jgi:putative aldouronate transport system substrate-binding protein
MERWVAITTDLKAYTETSMDEFITGRRSLNEWDAYVAATKAMGSDEAAAEVQKWYDDYFRIIGQ